MSSKLSLSPSKSRMLLHSPLYMLHAPAHCILLDLITQIVFPQHIVFSIPLLPITSSLLGAYIFLGTHFRASWADVPPSMYSTTFHALSHPYSPATFKKWRVFSLYFLNVLCAGGRRRRLFVLHWDWYKLFGIFTCIILRTICWQA